MFQVLKGHAALISSLVPGTLTYVLEGGESQKREIAGGVADINSNVVSVCLSLLWLWRLWHSDIWRL